MAHRAYRQRRTFPPKSAPRAPGVEPLAHDPPRLNSIDWKEGTLRLILDRPVNGKWVMALHNMGNYSSVYGKGPPTFHFNGNVALVAARPEEVQAIVDHFKPWLPAATKALKATLEAEARRIEAEVQRRLQVEKQHEEARLRVLRDIKL
jgi:eukaryotic-like serine/threonine-protein kinase